MFLLSYVNRKEHIEDDSPQQQWTKISRKSLFFNIFTEPCTLILISQNTKWEKQQNARTYQFTP